MLVREWLNIPNNLSACFAICSHPTVVEVGLQGFICTMSLRGLPLELVFLIIECVRKALL
jgi:hypothetical protein